MSNIILIGFMGSGKTTVGKILAKRMDRAFYDSDIEIEKKIGMSVKEIFDLKGEAEFRVMETQMLHELAKKEDVVIATGGGIVKNEKNIEILKTTGILFFLNTDIDVIISRLEHDNSRPLLETENKIQQMKELLNERMGLYKKYCDFEIVSTDMEQICQFVSEKEELYSRK